MERWRVGVLVSEYKISDVPENTPQFSGCHLRTEGEGESPHKTDSQQPTEQDGTGGVFVPTQGIAVNAMSEFDTGIFSDDGRRMVGHSNAGCHPDLVSEFAIAQAQIEVFAVQKIIFVKPGTVSERFERN
jgi:hypothetical protein